MSRTDLIRIKTVWQLYSLNNYFQTFLVLSVYVSLFYFHKIIQ